MAGESVISLAERLKQRREELGISQSQAARELDVARTAYRLWELEASKPSPDRWRLIARWLGVSVTTMLLAEELLTEEEAMRGKLVELDFARTGKSWDDNAAQNDFFAQAGAFLADGVSNGEITEDQARGLQVIFDRIKTESTRVNSAGWEASELRRVLPVDASAARRARQALSVVAEDIPEAILQSACLLVSELVTNSVRHGPSTAEATIGLFVTTDRDSLRVEVADGSAKAARPRTPTETGGYGLTLVAELADRWGAGRERARNVTWFELDLPLPGVDGSRPEEK
jgi:transcriptional regulator with XRE-family HTH domain/anti-sigma regulatory factor (Ser/Thr protein kinase)